MRIVIAQINPTVGDVVGNTELIVTTATEARQRCSADLVIFPELTLLGYPPEDLLLRPGLQARIEAAVQTLKQSVKGVAILFGLPSFGQRGLYNSAMLLSEGEVLALYHKQQLPNYGVFDEKRYFIAGDQPCVVAFQGLKLGISLCEDIWTAKVAAQAKEAGAQLLLNLNASPFHWGKGEQRRAVLQARSAETGLPLVYVNQVGGQDELVFDGDSMLLDAKGKVVLQGHSFQEALLPFEINAEGELTPLCVDPVEALSEEAATYQALVLGVRDYVTKNGFKGAVIGLSGGIDSALTLTIAVDALGADQVEAVMMPSRYTADMSRQDAEAEAKSLGVLYRSISIEPLFEGFLTALQDEFAGLKADTTEENIQARCRGVILMAISNKKGKILLTTGNKSEMAVGYATLYGDMAGGFAPLKDVPKTLVYRLARYRNREQEVIPERVIVRPPSAELAPDQKDEDSLPPYAILDAILERFVERDESLEQMVAAGFERHTVQRVMRMVVINEYKRRQAPPGVRVTQRAFGRDRRYPITSA
ncbi:MAG: NAD+ synthase, partial [Gammaproteobacteria bacterium]|nr:NAD+ synthase [Gammaproteobacteria bacterium]